MTSLNRGSVVEQILELLREVGPMTVMDIADTTGIDRYKIHAAMKRMTDPNVLGGKRAYVKDYVYQADGARPYPRAVFALGNKPCKRRPKRDQKEVKRRYEQRRNTLLRNSSVFNLGRPVAHIERQPMRAASSAAVGL